MTPGWYTDFSKRLVGAGQSQSQNAQSREEEAFQSFLQSIHDAGNVTPQETPPRPRLNDTELGIAAIGSAFVPDQNRRFQEVTGQRLAVKDRDWEQKAKAIQDQNELAQQRAKLKVSTSQEVYSKAIKTREKADEMKFKWADLERKDQAAKRRAQLARDLQDDKNKGNRVFLIEKWKNEALSDVHSTEDVAKIQSDYLNLLSNYGPARVQDIKSKIASRDADTSLKLATFDSNVLAAREKARKIGKEADLAGAREKVQDMLLDIMPRTEARKWAELAELVRWHDMSIQLGMDKLDAAGAAADEKAAMAVEGLFNDKIVTAQAESAGYTEALKDPNLDDDQVQEIKAQQAIADKKVELFKAVKEYMKYKADKSPKGAVSGATEGVKASQGSGKRPKSIGGSVPKKSSGVFPKGLTSLLERIGL